MSEVNNETSEADLWPIGLAELRTNKDLLKLAVRTRLNLESVKAQRELDLTIVEINDQSTIHTELMRTLLSAQKDLNERQKEFDKNYNMKSKSLYDMELRTEEKRKEFTELETRIKMEQGFTLSRKTVTALVSAASVLSVFIGSLF